MKNTHVLPTDKPSRLFDDGIELYFGELKDRKRHSVTSYNIYITNDEEIKEGEEYWFLTKDSMVLKSKNTNEKGYSPKGKKIILTTDQDLIKDGIQTINDEFLEWFVKNPSCEEVEISSEILYEHKDTYRPYPSECKNLTKTKVNYYLSIIPKEEPCTCTDECLGYLTKTCKRIEEEPKQELKVGDSTNFGIITDIKEYSVCFGKNKIGVDIWYKKSDVKLEPKKETLEEAAKDYIENTMRFSFNSMETKTQANRMLKCVEFGAKWQQERSYSEEEVIDLINLRTFDLDLAYSKKPIYYLKTKEWFEQFKKK